MVTLGVWMLAEKDKAPEWNDKIRDVAPYIQAAEKLHPYLVPAVTGQAR